MKLLISPHNDDETLFAAFTIMKEKPLVCVVFDSYVQVARGHAGATAERRRQETQDGIWELMKGSQIMPRPREASIVTFIGLRDDAPDWEYFRTWLKQRRDGPNPQFDGIICPAWEQNGHDQHNGVARICRDLWPAEQRIEYLTYTRTHGRSRSAHEVIPTPDMIARKHRALACYASQMEVENCRDWFLGDLREYILPPAEIGAKP